jgi:subtilase family serine protease
MNILIIPYFKIQLTFTILEITFIEETLVFAYESQILLKNVDCQNNGACCDH